MIRLIQLTIIAIKQIPTAIGIRHPKITRHPNHLISRSQIGTHIHRRARERKPEPPIVFAERIQRSIVERCHQVGFCRHPRRTGNMKCPCLLRARLELIAERLPFHHQSFIGFRTDNPGLVGIKASFPHQSKGNGYRITITCLIRITECFHFPIQLHLLCINAFLIIIHINKERNVFFARPDIEGRRSIASEGVSVLIKPCNLIRRRYLICLRE